MRYFLILILLIELNIGSSYGQGQPDSTRQTMSYNLNGTTYVYPKPKPFGFITQLPKTFGHAAKETFRKESLGALALITASTLVLLPFDQDISDGINQFSRYINLNPEREYKTIIGFKLGNTEVNAYEAPQNLNTFLYSIGEGSTSVFICAGIFIYGKAKKDYRALQTSSQLMQTLLAVGVTTQVLKRVSGRESPFVASRPGGAWRPFTNLATYQKEVPKHDAFPSGHLATMMATTVVISDNYPEKKWIKPLGYGLTSIVGLAMINNGVHWSSDYPLAIGIGYVFGKVTVKMNRWVKGER